MEKLIDLKYHITWRLEQLIHKISRKHLKPNKITKIIKEILRGG